MPWLFLGLANIVERLVTWLITKGIKQGAYFLAYTVFVIGLFTAFLAVTYTGINALKPLTPNGVGFALAFLPPQTAAYISFYLTTLIGKRVYDWHKQLSRDFTQATMRF